MAGRTTYIVAATVALALGLGAYLGARLFYAETGRTLFLTGVTSDGHHQMEERCDLCHVPFKGIKESACHDCHDAELGAVQDSHPARLFRDPGNAGQLDRIDALSCLRCHNEHLARDYPDGVTIARDFCMACHGDVAQRYPSHADFPAHGCRDCHNYHDNSALNEDFLAEHSSEPNRSQDPRVPARSFSYFYRRSAEHPPKALTSADRDAPPQVEAGAAADWVDSSHARSGVNCTDCHGTDGAAWVARPDQGRCAGCHAQETQGFLAGKHGMRLALHLPPMSTAEGRLPFVPDAKTVTCFSCHPAHRFDTRTAAVEACLGCHADRHSVAYKESPHFRLWQDEQRGRGPAGSGVSCATCHLPRIAGHRPRGKPGKKRPEQPVRVRVEHNQNANLNPSQKMVRTVCLNCHGLPLVINALADQALTAKNFSGLPAKPLGSLEMVEKRR